MGRFGPQDFPHVFRAYERAMLLEVERLCRAIPHHDLAIQWDIAHEMIIFDGRWQAPYVMWRPFPGMGAVFAANVERLAAAVPDDVELGLHLCYGDRDAHHFIEPLDAGKLVEFATLILERVRRPLDWLHVPVPIGRNDEAYYAPFRDLHLGAATELYLGLVHAGMVWPGTRRRIGQVLG